MACISKLASAIAYDCDSGATGLKDAMIINKGDIASFGLNNPNKLVETLVLSAGATAYKIDTVKRSLVLSSALKINEGAPNAYSHTATLTVTKADSPALRSMMDAFANGSFIILARTNNNETACYGLYYGLGATSSDKSSHDNGSWTTVTLETPENVIGEDSLAVANSVYNGLYAAAVG